MSNQINEGAARYNNNTSSHFREGGDLPEFSGSQGTQSPQQLVTDHLDLWTSTVTPKSTSGRGRGSGKSSKIELTGIKKLRELILELAVRGKLVAQNPDDEPASKLLERIEAEKAQLIKDGKLKKQKPLAPISEDEKPFELPEGWEWSKLGKLCSKLTDGSHNPPKNNGSGYPMLSSQNVVDGKIDFQNPSRYVSEADFDKENSRTQVQTGDVLLTIVASLGRSAVVPASAPEFVLQRSVAVLATPIDSHFLAKQLVAPLCLNYFDEHAKGTAQRGIYLGKLSEMPIATPPLAEQQRIVAKVDELMALCDQLAQQSEHQLTAHQQLTDTLLGTLLQPAAGALTESADATTKSSQKEQLNDNWQRLANHFDLLFSGPMGAWAIDRLKDTILQLAVMGKLVPQNPDDEPASKLLERIEEEKALLVKEGKIKKPKKLPPVSDEEKPFELPEGWEWVRFGKLCELITSGSRDWAKYYSESGAKFITMGNLSRGSYVLRLENLRFVSPPKNSEGKRTKLEAGDIVISITGDVGNLGLIPEDFGEAYINQHSCLVRLTATQKNRYVVEFLRTPLAKQQFNEPQRGIKNSFRLSDVDFLMMPLPPLAEQRRIVAKVDELFALCDQLKERLQQASETEQHLTNAIVEQALG